MRPWLTLSALVLTACGASTGAKNASSTYLSPQATPEPVSKFLSPARLFPVSTEGMPQFGREAGGAVRLMKEGRRFLSRPDGGIETTDAPGFSTWTLVEKIPDRLGGGFFFRDRRGAPALYRASSWLAPVEPFYQHYTDVSDLWFGIDRVILVSATGARTALDPSGAVIDVGALPLAPHVKGLAALDGWNALALTDGRAVMSHDAGATWAAATLPGEPTQVTTQNGVFRVTAAATDGRSVTYLVKRDGTFAEERISPEPPKVPKPPGVFGALPLVQAVASGIPLSDGTALVAKDGVLGRVQLSDGVLVEKHDAFDMKSASCTPVALSPRSEATAASPAKWGFVCGEPKGRTMIYALERGALRPLRAFANPRAVFASGEGGLAVRGGCDEDAPAESTSHRRVYCVHHPRTGFREILLTGNVGAERVVVLNDGRVAVLTPPAFDLSTARLTIIDTNGTGKTVPVTFPAAKDTVTPLLGSGLWLDGFELRGEKLDRIGGWVAAGPTLVGVEIALDGTAQVGEHIIDVGNPVVSGRFGLGWTTSGRGFETTDGGFKWTPVDMPQPGVEPEKNPPRACSLVGCVMQGWIRVGWNASNVPKPGTIPAAKPPVRASQRALRLECENATPANAPPKDAAPRVAAAIGGRLVDQPSDVGPFHGLIAPSAKKSERAYVLDATMALGRQNPRPEARFVALGPRLTSWEESNTQVLVEWWSPYEMRAHTTAFGGAPGFLVDAARAVTTSTVTPRGRVYTPSYYYGGVAVTASADGKHAMISARRPGVVGLLAYALSDDRPPTELRRTDGEPWADIDDAVFADRAWYIAANAPNVPSAPSAGIRFSRSPVQRVTIYRADGATARELTTVRRPQNRTNIPLLVSEQGGHRVGVLVEGDPTPGSISPSLWVMPIDTESGQAGDPEPLGSADLSDVSDLHTCDDPARGWLWSTSLTDRRVELEVSAERNVSVSGVNARLVTGARGTCVQSLVFTTGSLPAPGTLHSRPNTMATRDGRPTSLACHVAR